MSSRVSRALLRLYPRRIRDRYGAELLDLEDELRASGEVSRTRLLRDILAGAFLAWPARRRMGLIGGAFAILCGLAITGTVLGERSRGQPPASHPRVLVAQSVPVAPYGSCFIGGSSCAITSCTEFIDEASSGPAVSQPATVHVARRGHLAARRCVEYPDARHSRAVLVARPASPAQPRRAPR